jgi:cbb3-type cytochrome oxidase subunit 3
MGPLAPGIAQSWLTVGAMVLSQLFTLLFIGGIAYVLRRKRPGPLDERSASRAGRLSRSVRYFMVSVIAALILLSPVLAFLTILTAEMLIDLLMEAGTTLVSAIAIGGAGWALFRRYWPRGDRGRRLGPGLVSDEGAIAAPPV